MAVRKSNKQEQAYNYLADTDTKYIVYGGAAGGGKSWLGCEWLLQCCHYLPNTRWFVGRNNIKDTRESVIITFKKVADAHGYTFYDVGQDGITFWNGSHILFLDCTYYPYKDPLFERFGSKEFTGGWLEEAGQIHGLAFDVLKSRVGRHLNSEYQLTPKILITCNPKKNWIYKDFYKLAKDNELPSDRAFIQALPKDNPFLTEDYIASLSQIKDKATRERLLNGNWEYDNNPNALIEYDAILSVFKRGKFKRYSNVYISADIALHGSDRLVIGVWEDMNLAHVYTIKKADGKSVVESLQAIKKKHNVPARNIVFDADGVGSFLKGYMSSAIAFHNNGKPISTTRNVEQYQNIKTQCYYKLAEVVNARELTISASLSEIEKQEVIEELEQVKSHDTDKDGKLKLIPKQEVKQVLGRSPDYTDMMAMRMLFELRNKVKAFSVSV